MTNNNKPKITVINLNKHYYECSVCGESTTSEYGIPMYEDIVLPNNWSGEWFGQPACQRCFELQNKLTKPVNVRSILTN